MTVQRFHHRMHVVLAASMLLTVTVGVSAAVSPGVMAKEILGAAGVRGGLIVHVGCGDGQLTAGFRAGEEYLVLGLDADEANVARLRAAIRAKGLYGPVTVDRFDGKTLPMIDNAVNLVFAEDPGAVPMAEFLRVLVPGGVAYVKQDGKPNRLGLGHGNWVRAVKGRPANIDKWTHYLHGPDNNAVAHDTVVGPPRHMQWLAGPAWTRSHHVLNSISAVVTDGGRIFTIVDEATASNLSVPAKWAIVARDAFNGVRLWTKPLPSWVRSNVRFRSGPPQVTRLLVVSQGRLYAPLGLNEPVSVLDAATGRPLAVCRGTAGAEEIVVAGDVALVLTGDPAAEQAAGVARLRGMKLPNTKTIVATKAQSGEKLWDWTDEKATPMPETLASDGRQAYVQSGGSVVCLDLKTGKPQWRYGDAGSERRGSRSGYGRHVLLVADGVVLCNLGRQLVAISARTGEKLWQTAGGMGFHAPMDVFVIDGVVWQGMHPRDSVAPPPVDDFSTGRDLHTGKVVRENTVMVDLQTAGHHHRCYREKATARYILAGKRGIEMMELTGDGHSRNNWVRGTCQYGILPANGLLYAPSHSCGCYMESLLYGFWALAPASAEVTEGRPASSAKATAGKPARLTKGPAYGAVKGQLAPEEGGEERPSTDWPQYRHDPLRSGIAGTALPAKLKRAWRADVGGRLTQPVVAGGKVIVASVDAGTVHAVDAKTGQPAWTFAAGGRVDSPPAIHNGMVLFGSADGRVYCLRLDDGQLVWHFLAAPADRRTVAMGRVESVWPVHGSVLVLNGVAYAAAGRSTWLDGGIELLALDPASGKVLHKQTFRSRHPVIGEGKEKASPEQNVRVSQNVSDYKTLSQPDLADSFSMAGGSVADVLTSDGRNVFMHHVKFDASLRRQKAMSRHLFSTSNLLDGAENHRSHWVLGTGDFSMVPVAYSWIVNGSGKRSPGIAVPAGLMMVFADDALWVVRRRGNSGSYTLHAKDNTPFAPDAKPLPDFRKKIPPAVKKSRWTTALTIRPRAMLKAGDVLLLGGTSTDAPADDPHAPYEGRTGGVLQVFSAADGKPGAEYKLDSPVVWDGLAAANGRVYVSTTDGALVCLGERK